MRYRGFYINLDSSSERRRSLQQQLARYHLQRGYERFPACQGNVLDAYAPNVSPGNIGCFTSHYRLLKSQIGSAQHLHVAEDDILFSPATEPVLDSLIESGRINDWDLLFTDVLVPPDLRLLQDLSVRFRQCARLNPEGLVERLDNFCLLPLKNRVFASTTSYLVNKDSLGKVTGLLEQAVQTEIPLPIDLFYRRKIQEGRLMAACVFPFVTSVEAGHSLASEISPDASAKLHSSLVASMLLRSLFFVASNPRGLLAACESHLRGGPLDPRDQVLSRLCQFVVSPNFQFF